MAAVVLVVASTARAMKDRRRPEVVLPPDSSSAVPRQLLASWREAATQERRRAPLAAGERIDPNRAPVEELDRIPGVGPALARAIVEERSRGGAFGAPADLERVPGIGAKSLVRLTPYLEFGRRRIAEPGPRPLSPGSVLLARPQRASASPLDLNRATPAELATLPGIGPEKADRIVELRRVRGGFRNVKELLGVPGIGPATLDRLQSHVVIRR
ncbi:MAG: helix-hairpin-helix domain-containing protein [Gemmatimonadetes bacterium]|nr:helix-hairpin-helix domain-containing protein [Gemmatimonadota bacterium]